MLDLMRSTAVTRNFVGGKYMTLSLVPLFPSVIPLKMCINRNARAPLYKAMTRFSLFIHRTLNAPKSFRTMYPAHLVNHLSQTSPQSAPTKVSNCLSASTKMNPCISPSKAITRWYSTPSSGIHHSKNAISSFLRDSTSMSMRNAGCDARRWVFRTGWRYAICTHKI